MSGISQENLDLWIKELRTTTSEQAHGLLQDIEVDGYAADAFCCLGIYDRSQGIDYETAGYVRHDMESTRTKARSGLTIRCQDMLAEINDHWAHFGFPEIADLLDANRESLIATGDLPGDWYADHAHHIPGNILNPHT